MGSLRFHPSGITISITKSSIAIYKTSSIAGLNLWISSIKRISQLSKLFKTLTNSLGLEIAYHVIIFILVPSWLATIHAIVVFQNPLGQENNRCHNRLSLFFALSIAVARTDFIGSWPINWTKESGLWGFIVDSFVSSQIFFISILFLTNKAQSLLCWF